MSRALILLLLALRAEPARYTLDAIRLRATVALPAQQRELSIRLEGAPALRATLLYDAGRAHLAFRDALGVRGPTLRMADGMLGFTDATTTWLAPDAVEGVRLLLGDDVTPAQLVDLALGRAPEGAWSRVPAGAEVRSGGLVARVDREGRLQAATAGALELAFADGAVTVRRRSLEARVELGAPTYREVPEQAFALTDGRVVWVGSSDR
ncbi:MAG: hypothetical protein H6736_08040 [Alphaproteobacteria bacterium]|nr:hypothetical protein [Alphaproteobacteria bacterium]MCB9691749.1 hypothetical protein [Alphaproteobacteria bacterium]